MAAPAGTRPRPLGLLLASALLAGGCAKNVVVEGDFPQPVLEKLPITLGLHYPSAFRNHEFTDTENTVDAADWLVRTGAAQVRMHDTLLAGMFERVVALDTFPLRRLTVAEIEAQRAALEQANPDQADGEQATGSADPQQTDPDQADGEQATDSADPQQAESDRATGSADPQQADPDQATGSADPAQVADTPPPTGPWSDVDGILVPYVDELQYSIPSHSKINVFEIWMRYRYELYAPDGELLAEWIMTCYGKTPTAFLRSAEAAVNLAARAALRDAGANFALNFTQVPEVKAWMNNVQSARQRATNAGNGVGDDVDNNGEPRP